MELLGTEILKVREAGVGVYLEGKYFALLSREVAPSSVCTM